MAMSQTTKTETRHARKPKTKHARFSVDEVISRTIASITPAAVNETVYKPVVATDPEVQALAKDIKQHGLLEPIVITLDGVIISGHRRFAAAKLARLKEVRCRIHPILSGDPEFIRLLTAFNNQRHKTLDEILREEVVRAEPAEAHRALVAHRLSKQVAVTDDMEIRERKARAKISPAKRLMVEAIHRILAEQREYWPLTDRRVHYALLNDPPLRHASKPGSIYRNNKPSYDDLTSLLTRGRLEGYFPWAALADETRPIELWNVHASPQPYLRKQINGFLRGYWRNLMQSQPSHVEIVGEKNTVKPVIESVASDYTIPVTTGRGFSSLPPRYDMAKRFRESGKDQLVLLIVSDFDPSGEEIAHSFAASMRDDFHIANITAKKVALCHEHVARFDLKPNLQAKEDSQGYRRFVRRYGKDVFELEALESENLAQLLREAIDEVIDHDLFEKERQLEHDDAAYLDSARQRVHVALNGIFSEEER